MLYVKPSDVRYVDMCVWIDKHAYDKDCDEQKLFEYLYFIAIMLSHKAKLFKKKKDYEDFAIFMASRTYFRLKNPKQQSVDSSGTPKMDRLKSVLNYMKSILYPCKVDFQQQFYAQTEISLEDTNYYSEYSFADRIRDSVDEIELKEFEFSLSGVIDICKSFLYKIPYKKDSAEWKNIYTSCILSLLNSMTLDNKTLYRISHYKTDKDAKENFYSNLYIKESEDCTVLFHLPDYMYEYITVLVRQIKHEMVKNLSYDLRTTISYGQGLSAAALMQLNGTMNYEGVYEE